MYPVSAAYMAAIGRPVKTRRITGTIGNVSFDDSNVVVGTLKVDNRCSEGTELTIGSVYIGQLTCVFKGIDFTGQWMGKIITLSEELLVGEDTWEAVPLGVYHVVEAQHQETGVYVVAYDVMDYLDEPFTLSATSGTPYDLCMLIADACDVTFAQTEEQIRALPNGEQAFVLYPENDITTYRDLLFWVAQSMACFATATRDGKIEFRTYAGDPVDAIGKSTRWEGSSFSDYVTRYTGVSVTRLDSQDVIYKGLPVDDGLTYSLGSNPFMQTMTLDGVLWNILEELAKIAFTPFNVDRSGCPAYDLGDVVTFPDGIGGGRTGCIMAYEYDYHDVYMIDGYGANPALMGAQSKADKEIAGIMSRSNSNEVQFYTFTNGKSITLGENQWKDIINIRFGSMKNSIVTFQAEIKMRVQTSNIAVGEVRYIYNDNEISYHPVETWLGGDHLLHLLYFFAVSGGEVNTLRVQMRLDFGTAVIDRASIQAAVSGQGLAASDKWDGWIIAEDNIIYAPFGNEPTGTDAIGEDVDVALKDVIVLEFTEGLSPKRLEAEPTPTSVQSALYINKYPLKDLTWGEVNEYTWAEIKDGYNW